ncbi:hypothetical protein SAMN04487949_2609 [Halogranum gelatinilyticum]|uniref:Uncharacterized protein n=1 Tax=Halogranum gelatinilyticum TaxID=660521 RepID=A0A1G9W433_9EURY|nr:hypothetical protein [Halogranum gelatinilyticum]SDM79250.1 hypothetical protein SAMN04487949_2609 [Halogranum gelatinilyticum]
MFETAYRVSLFALYQFTVVVGIVLLPVALMARQLGVELPLSRVLERLGRAYENAGAR